MANFFKEYHAELKEKRTVTENKEKEYVYSIGEPVYIHQVYGKNNKKYFADYLERDMVLLADSKKDAMSGYGYIYSKYDII